jgi:hypothetical protein
MRKMLLALTFMISSCASDSGSESELETGTAEQEIEACRFVGWRWDQGEPGPHYRCNAADSTHGCYVPIADNFNVFSHQSASVAVPSAYQTAFTNARNYLLLSDAINWTTAACTETGTNACSLRVVNAAISGTHQKTTLPVDEVLQFTCPIGSKPSESVQADIWACKQVRARVDFTKFDNWLTFRGATASQASNMRIQLMRHMFGVASGLGATDATNTAMRRTFVVNSPSIALQEFEFAMLHIYDWTNPGSYSTTACP